jgi:hypothetical protein
LIVLGLLILVVPFASRLPDGLERVAQSLGFQYKSNVSSTMSAPLKDYAIPGMDTLEGASIAAGLVGAIAVFGLSFFVARFLVPKRAEESPTIFHQS